MRLTRTTVPLLAFLACLLPALAAGADAPQPAPQGPKVRKAAVRVEVALPAPAEAQKVGLWLPFPMSDADQDVTGVRFTGNYSTIAVHRTPSSSTAILYAEWSSPAAARTLAYSFMVARREARTGQLPLEEAPDSPREFGPWLAATRLGPVTGKVKEIADSITKGKVIPCDRARAVYDWVVDNMVRDPAVKGCGEGDVDHALGCLSGKCADISSVFISLLRSAGIPAREVFGIRLPAGKEGDMTKSQHCWVEFHLPGQGWVPADPADVAKAILEKKLAPEQARPVREYYFGGVDENRLAFGPGREVVLNPPQAGAPLNYFMYPYAEADGKPLNEDLFGMNLGVKVTFREAGI